MEDMKRSEFNLKNSFGCEKAKSSAPQMLTPRSFLGKWTNSGRKHWDLFRHVVSQATLSEALNLVLANGGSHGIDKVTCESVKLRRSEFLLELREKLQAKTYRPCAVRRVYIPKRDGRKRPLGIPTIEDRVVQRALVLVLEPIYEEIFLPSSYGFRPGRSAQECCYEIAESAYRRRCVIDADIEDFFGSVVHRKLLGMLKEQIADPRILELVERFLRAGCMEQNIFSETKRGTPQGGPLSPLLANIYLHYALDVKFAEFAATTKRVQLFRYADDVIVTCESASDLRFMVAEMKRWLAEAGLKFHKTKSRAVNMSNENDPRKAKFDFLGFKFHLRGFRDNPKRKWIARQPSERARKQLRANLKSRLTSNLDYDEARRMVNWIWKGWAEYFRYGNSNRVFYRDFRNVRRAVIRYLRRKHRRQRCPVRWKKLIPKAEYIWKESRPLSVIPGSPSLAKIAKSAQFGRAVCGKSARTVR